MPEGAQHELKDMLKALVLTQEAVHSIVPCVNRLGRMTLSELRNNLTGTGRYDVGGIRFFIFEDAKQGNGYDTQLKVPDGDLERAGDQPNERWTGFAVLIKCGANLKDWRERNTYEKCTGCGKKSYGVSVCEIDECLKPICVDCGHSVAFPGDGRIMACSKSGRAATRDLPVTFTR